MPLMGKNITIVLALTDRLPQLLAQVMLLAAAVCFAASLVCAGACFRGSKIARWYLLLVLVMIMVAVLFGDGGG